MNLSDLVRVSAVVTILFWPFVAQANDQRSKLAGERPAIQVSPDQTAISDGKLPIDRVIKAGRLLFETRFNIVDGAGRPESTGDGKPTIRLDPGPRLFQRIAGPDANSCAGCHNQPLIGGSGDIVANVFVGAHASDPPTDQASSPITNSRNTISMFGAGVIETLAAEMSDDLAALRASGLAMAKQTGKTVRIALVAKDVSFGHLTLHPDGKLDVSELEGIDDDLVIRPFGVKGVAVSIREFTNAALNQHHGIQSIERFGWARTGMRDFDGDGVLNEFSIGQLTALSLFQAALPPPRRHLYDNAADEDAAERGEQVFSEIGCASCHRPKMPLRSAVFQEPNRYNRPGTAVPDDIGGSVALSLPVQADSGLFRDDAGQLYVRAFTDLKRHVICDDQERYFCDEQVVQDFVPADQFLSSKLWDAGSSAPYGHRGDLTTLSEAILHHAGEARPARDGFLALDSGNKRALILYLQAWRVDTEG